jgi:chromosome segregation ATPase
MKNLEETKQAEEKNLEKIRNLEQCLINETLRADEAKKLRIEGESKLKTLETDMDSLMKQLKQLEHSLQGQEDLSRSNNRLEAEVRAKNSENIKLKEESENQTLKINQLEAKIKEMDEKAARTETTAENRMDQTTQTVFSPSSQEINQPEKTATRLSVSPSDRQESSADVHFPDIHDLINDNNNSCDNQIVHEIESEKQCKCGATFHRKYELFRHVKNHDGTFFVCDFCGKPTARLDNHNRHVRDTHIKKGHEKPEK